MWGNVANENVLLTKSRSRGELRSELQFRDDIMLFFALLPHAATLNSHGLSAADLNQYRLIASQTGSSPSDVRKLRELVLSYSSRTGLRESILHSATHLSNKDPAKACIQEIVPNLFISSAESASDRAALQAHDITHICCCIGVHAPFPDAFHYHILPAKDRPEEDIRKFFKGACTFIENSLRNGGKCLIHCGAGISRASTISIAYLMYKLRIPFTQAYSLVRSARPIIKPNSGFVEQLRDFEFEIKAGAADYWMRKFN